MLPKFNSAVLFVSLIISSHASANLVTNGSFEAPPGFALGAQGVMPPGWVATNLTPDLYSTDGSFGLAPGYAGNFPGVAAQNGLGWVAGASGISETFAQELGAPLTPGVEYSISAYLMQAERFDLNHTGAYEILLNSSNSFSGAVLAATWDPTTGSDSWEYRNAIFTAPANASLLPWLIFRPYASGSSTAYPGLDNVVLAAVPEPSSCLFFFFSAAIVALAACRRPPNRPTKR